MTLGDFAAAQFQQNYCIGCIEAGLYFYQSNRGSDVGYLSSWCFALNAYAINCGVGNVQWNNRTGGGVLNNAYVVTMSNSYTSQKVNMQQYYRAGNGPANDGAVVDGAAINANDNLLRFA